MPAGSGPRWNPDTQSWETGPTRPTRPYTGPMPPRPAAPPTAPGPTAGPTAPAYPPGPSYDPGADTPGGPVPDPAAGRRTRILIAGAVAAVVVVGAGGGYLLWGRGADVRPAARPTASASSATAAAPTGPATASASPTASASATSVPSGYHLVHDEKGFTLAVPDGWQRELRPTGVFYTSPDSRSLLQIFQITEPDLTPRQALEQASKGLSGNPGYKELGIEPRQGPAGAGGVQLTYAYDSDRLGIRVQAVDCAFTVPDGRQFAVLALGPESDWPRQEGVQQVALGSFAPTA
ncbi:hypothetical protein [Streptomyces noursei]|uniref:hypothetical protein n=2 Tax=Streptomyces TaxID=1883 RepID=UPI001F03737F|nr:hypothetical protein [Streptomyces noursei]